MKFNWNLRPDGFQYRPRDLEWVLARHMGDPEKVQMGPFGKFFGPGDSDLACKSKVGWMCLGSHPAVLVGVRSRAQAPTKL